MSAYRQPRTTAVDQRAPSTHGRSSSNAGQYLARSRGPHWQSDPVKNVFGHPLYELESGGIFAGRHVGIPKAHDRMCTGFVHRSSDQSPSKIRISTTWSQMVPRKGLSGNARETRKINYLNATVVAPFVPRKCTFVDCEPSPHLRTILNAIPSRRSSNLLAQTALGRLSTNNHQHHGSMDLWIYERLRAFAACGSATSAAKAVHC